MKPATNIFLVDADTEWRQRLEQRLRSQGLDVRSYADAEAFWDDVRDGDEPRGCLVLENELPGMSGLELQDRLRALGWSLPVLFTMTTGSVPLAVAAMKGGAFHVNEKPLKPCILLQQIRDAIAQDATSRKISGEVRVIRARLAELSQRELEILRWVVAGRRSHEIATALFLSIKTVQTHRANIMRKMEVEGVAELVRVALWGGVEPVI